MMVTNTSTSQNYERVLLSIIRTLPPNRVEQLLDFARFLEAQLLAEDLTQGEDLAEIEADNAHWETLLATDASQDLLEKLAAEALAEHQEDKTKGLKFNSEGHIIPE